MNCRNCQKPIQEGFNFCPYCGTEAVKNIICPSCKQEVKPDWVACPNCGITLQRKKEPFSQPDYRPQHKHEGFWGSSSLKKQRRKGFLGHLFSS